MSISSESSTLLSKASNLFSHVNLVQKTMLVVVVMLVTIMSTAMWFQIQSVTAQRTQELEKRAQLVAQIQGTGLAAPVWNMETNSILCMLRGLTFDKAFAAAQIVDQQGAVQQKIGDVPEESVKASSPILYDSQPIGSVEVYYSKNTLYEEIRHMTYLYIGLGLLLLFATMLSLYGALQMIMRPLARLRTTMLALAEGNTSIDIPALDRQDEIGAMAKTVDVFKQNKIRGDQLSNETTLRVKRDQEHALETTKAVDTFVNDVTSSLSSFQAAIGQLNANAKTMAENADNTRTQTQSVDSETTQSAENIAAMSEAVQRLREEVAAINEKVTLSLSINREAVSEAEKSSHLIEQSAQTANDIVGVVSLIENIAAQTNLLALNATIEAARAGEAGRGFAVVAQEVRTLAGQTGSATKTIQEHVTAIQEAMDRAVTAINSIVKTISRASAVSDDVHSAVTAQDQDVQAISGKVADVVTSGQTIATSMVKVSDAASLTSRSADEINKAAMSLDKESRRLKAFIDRFVSSVATRKDD
ncbi:MAG TPA: hypothetical protein DCY07_08645 [Rhodospirillaceae bacterium]|nr:hypothetical protein [Rhodospirillaceae bacterium]